MVATKAVLALSLFGVVACSSAPPPHWATGGAPLAIQPAAWRTASGGTVELHPDGKVFVEGSESFSLDRAGRVFDSDNEPVAILLPDGNLVGTDDVYLGRIGLANASPPGRDTAWVAVLPDGSVLRFEPDGERSSDGAWQGCAGAAHRACTLITHLVELDRAARSRGAVFVGFGVGFYH
jgi:hypothetical protein